MTVEHVRWVAEAAVEWNNYRVAVLRLYDTIGRIGCDAEPYGELPCWQEEADRDDWCAGCLRREVEAAKLGALRSERNHALRRLKRRLASPGPRARGRRRGSLQAAEWRAINLRAEEGGGGGAEHSEGVPLRAGARPGRRAGRAARASGAADL